MPDVARAYKAAGKPWVVIGDENYGEQLATVASPSCWEPYSSTAATPSAAQSHSARLPGLHQAGSQHAACLHRSPMMPQPLLAVCVRACVVQARGRPASTLRWSHATWAPGPSSSSRLRASTRPT